MRFSSLFLGSTRAEADAFAVSLESMRLLLINYEYPPIGAGAATATREMARSAVKQGHEVTVLTGAFQEHAGWCEDGGVSVLRVRSRRERADRCSIAEMGSFVFHAMLALRGVVRRRSPDACVVFFSMPCGPLGLAFRFLSGKPYVVSLRGGDVPGTEAGLARVHRWLAPLRRLVLRRARAVVANSPGLAALSERADPVPVDLVPNGVDIERFRPAGPPPGPFTFLFVGRLNEQKNVGLLLRAAADLAAKAARPFAVRIVGDGPLREALRRKCAELDLQQRVEWIPWLPREDMPSVYQGAHCLVNPSHYEGMPNVVLEAMACALPVIVSDVAGNRDVVENGVSGVVVAHDDHAALANAMASALADEARRADYGRRARAQVAERYSWDGATARYLALFAAR